MTIHELDAALQRLVHEFPDLPPDTVRSLLGDSYQLVVETTGKPLRDKAEELARLRLEVRAGHPAIAADTTATQLNT